MKKLNRKQRKQIAMREKRRSGIKIDTTVNSQFMKYFTNRYNPTPFDTDIFLKKTKNELQREVATLSALANERIREFTQRGKTSPTVSRVLEQGLFTAGNKTLNELRTEYMRVNQFLQSKTSDLNRWNEIQKKTIKTLNNSGVGITVEQYDKFWNAYQRARELVPSIVEKQQKYRVFQEIVSIMKSDVDIDIDEIARIIQERAQEIYEKNIEMLPPDIMNDMFKMFMPDYAKKSDNSENTFSDYF